MQIEDEVGDLAERLKAWNQAAPAKRKRRTVDGTVRASVVDGELVMEDRTTKSETLATWVPYRIGGWRGCSTWIDDAEPPLCSHDHAPPSREVMKALTPVALVESGFRSCCLTADWKDHLAGTACMTYFRGMGCGWMLFVSTKEPRAASVPQADLFGGA